MDGFYIESNGLPTGMITVDADIESLQFTNNLDGILRDSSGSPIQLDPNDFRHQAYCGSAVDYSECSGGPRRYVFKGGKLLKVGEAPAQEQFMLC